MKYQFSCFLRPILICKNDDHAAVSYYFTEFPRLKYLNLIMIYSIETKLFQWTRKKVAELKLIKYTLHQ